MHCTALFIQGQILTFSSFRLATEYWELRIGSIAFKVACLHTTKDFTGSKGLPFLDSSKCGECAMKALGTYAALPAYPQTLHSAPPLLANLCT